LLYTLSLYCANIFLPATLSQKTRFTSLRGFLFGGFTIYCCLLVSYGYLCFARISFNIHVTLCADFFLAALRFTVVYQLVMVLYALRGFLLIFTSPFARISF